MRVQTASPHFQLTLLTLLAALISVTLLPIAAGQISAPSFSQQASGLFQVPLQADEYQVIVLSAPVPLTDSEGRGVAIGQAVGTGRIPDSVYPDETHAVLWPAGSTVGVDLHPADFRYSAAFETNGQQQVGRGNGPPTNFAQHALLWA